MNKTSVLGYLMVIVGIVLLSYTFISTNLDKQDMDGYENEQRLMVQLRLDSTEMTTEMLLMMNDVVPDFTDINQDIQSMRGHLRQLAALERGEDRDGDQASGLTDRLISLMEKKLQLIDKYKVVYSHMRRARGHMIAGIDNLKRMLPLKQAALADNMLSHVLEYLITPWPQLRKDLLGLRKNLSAFVPTGTLQYSMHRFLANSEKTVDYNDQLHDIMDRVLHMDVEDAIDVVVSRERKYRREEVVAGNTRQKLLAGAGLLLLLLVAWGVRRIARSRQAEVEALRELEYQKRAIDQHSILAVTDLRGDIIEVNDLFCQVSQYSREEVIGHNHRMLKSGEHPDSFYADLWATVSAGLVWHGEVCNKKKDGSLYWVDSSIVPVTNDAGVILRYIAIRTDITARKQAELARQESEQCMQQVMNSALDAIVVVASGGRISHWNPAATQLFGYTAEAMVDRSNIGLLIPISVLDENVSLGRHVEIDVSCADGSFVSVDMSMSVLQQRDKKQYSIFFHDVSVQHEVEVALQRAAEEAQQAVESKSMFLSTVSHELRTPMNGVIGMSDLLMDTPLTEEQGEFVQTIRDSAEALLTIINDILDFSKIEAGKMDIETVDFDLRSVVEGSAVVVSHKIGHKPVALLPFVDPAIPKILQGDPTRLRQIMLNLIDNAMKFTSEGHVVARAEQVANSDGVVTVRFSVEDTGIGLSEAAQAKLFQPFVQADGSTTRKFGGTGLGLAICRRLVQLMGDDIVLHSSEGEGSTFSFTLKFAVGEVSDITHPAKEATANLDDLHLLLVDDDAVARDVLSRYLLSWNISVSCAENGAQMLEQLQACQQRGAMPDLLLIDLKMPHMDGLELADRVRALVGDDAPMVLCTAHDSMGLKHRATAHGFDVVLTKPVRMSQLFDAIMSALGLKTDDKPVVAATTEDVNQQRATLSASEAVAEGRLVLLVEDNSVNQRVAQMHLTKLGYTCHIANDGCEALQASECTPYSMILMDCQMPVMDGFEATYAIRKREQEQGEPHRIIIAMTANAMKGDRERCLEAGMDDYLSKPISRDRLQEVLDRWRNAAPLSSTTEQKTAVPSVEEERYFDVDYIRELVGDDDDIVRELLQLFYDSMHDVLRNKMAVALQNRAVVAMKAHAHELKGAAGNIGATTIEQRCQAIEQLIEGERWTEIEAAIAWLKQAHLAIGSWVTKEQ